MKKNALGWHSDDSDTMDDNYPIAIVSFGAERNISFRRIGAKGNPERQLLEDGSLLLMHAGMQTAWQHKIPKHDGPVDVELV